jgi:hypothetical protein
VKIGRRAKHIRVVSEDWSRMGLLVLALLMINLATPRYHCVGLALARDQVLHLLYGAAQACYLSDVDWTTLVAALVGDLIGTGIPAVMTSLGWRRDAHAEPG